MSCAACNQRSGFRLHRRDATKPAPKDQRANSHQDARKCGHPKNSQRNIRSRGGIIIDARYSLRGQTTSDGSKT
jgi:hypothetical protein